MADKSKIEWTDATVNFWWGCTKVGPGCDHCYAETFDKRIGGKHWGVGAPRRKIASAVKLICRLDNAFAEWAADAECARGNARAFGLPMPIVGNRRRVFIQSMSDLFDLEVPFGWFLEAWGQIEACDHIDIQIVTKRISVVEKRLAEIGRTIWPKHAGLIVTVVNQAEAQRDVPRLLDLKAKLRIPWVGLSVEPMLGPVDLRDIAAGRPFSEFIFPDWVICGGESGGKARPMHPDWPRSLRDQCKAASVPFFFKQWGAWGPLVCEHDGTFEYSRETILFSPGGNRAPAEMVAHCDFPNDSHLMERVGKKAAGRLLDGREHNEFPEART